MSLSVFIVQIASSKSNDLLSKKKQHVCFWRETQQTPNDAAQDGRRLCLLRVERSWGWDLYKAKPCTT